MLLQEPGRDAWVAAGGGALALSILEVIFPTFVNDPQLTSTPIQNEHVSIEYLFLASRILFLATLKQSAFLQDIIENKHFVGTLRNVCFSPKLHLFLRSRSPKRLDSLLFAVHASQAFSKEALTDMLKTTFNVMLQYPRMVEAASLNQKPSDPTSKTATEPKVLGELWDDRFVV